MLDAKYSKIRLQRLQKLLTNRDLDAAVCSFPQHVYYFTAHRPHPIMHGAAVIFADGRSWLTCANNPASSVAADQVVSYPASLFGTPRQDQPMVVAEQITDLLVSRKVRRLGIDAGMVNAQLQLLWEGICEPIEADLHQLRRRKDPDELELIKSAIRCSREMYRKARQIIEPGVDELDVYNVLHTVAVETAGEPMSALLGNDFACASRGGPPRNGRKAAAGELYILDLGPAVSGYFADNARTIAVDRKPTDEQHRTWEKVAHCLNIVEKMARPGVRCRDIFAAVDSYLKQEGEDGVPHHLGHGIGLQAHEFPHLNPKWDDALREGEVFTAEPGLYHEHLRAGVRLENNYLVTSNGVESLLDEPLGLI